MENVEPALDPPAVVTLKAKSINGQLEFKGELIKMGNLDKLKIGFEYNPYAGFVENLYSSHWDKTKLVELSENKDYSIALNELEKGKTYEYRAVVVHPQMRIYGDIKNINVK